MKLWDKTKNIWVVRTINRNMRCIEIHGVIILLDEIQMINRNMRCIEIIILIGLRVLVLWINRNMRCIEIM